MGKLLRGQKYTISLACVISFFLALAPVLDPYILLEIGSGITIRINDIFAIILALFSISHGYGFSRRYGVVISWCILISTLSLFGLLGTSNTSVTTAYKNICIWFIYAVLVMYLWKYASREKFFYWLENIALVCVAVIFLQFILGNLGITVWDGKLSFLNLSKYDSWSGFIDPNTGDIRPCGIFQEASYVGIYLLVAYASSLKNNNIVKALVFASAMLLTTSMVAILGCTIVTVYVLFFSNKEIVDSKTKRRIIEVLIVALFVSIMVGSKSVALQSLWEYVTRRIFNISNDLQGTRMGSTKWRLLGNIQLFSKYNMWQKCFGLGAQQYAHFFGVINYSNNIVNIVLNYGLVGISCFIVAFYRFFRIIDKENVIFFIITMIIFFSDQQWFNWFFFYLLTACVLESPMHMNEFCSRRGNN